MNPADWSSPFHTLPWSDCPRSDCPDCPLLCHYIAACLAFESERGSLPPGSCQCFLRMLSPFATVFRGISWAWSSERRGSWPEGHAEYTRPGLPCRKVHPGRPFSARAGADNGSSHFTDDHRLWSLTGDVLVEWSFWAGASAVRCQLTWPSGVRIWC